MFKKCKHRDRLMYAITNMHEEPDLFNEALENFRKYGAPLTIVESKANIVRCSNQTQLEGQ